MKFYKNDPPPFAEWLQDEFAYKTQREVADILKLSWSYVHDLGYGRRRLNVRLAVRIERAYPKFHSYEMLCLEIAYDLKRERDTKGIK